MRRKASWRPRGPWEWIGIVFGIWGIPGLIDDGGAWAAWLEPMNLYTEFAPFAVLLGVLLFTWGRLQRSRKHPKPDGTADYITAGAIIDNYLQHATIGMKPAVKMSVRFEILKKFESSPGAMLSEGTYNRERLRVWLESNMGKLLIRHRGDL